MRTLYSAGVPKDGFKNAVRIQPPGTGSGAVGAPFSDLYPIGYFIVYNGAGQPISVYSGRPDTMDHTHQPRRSYWTIVVASDMVMPIEEQLEGLDAYRPIIASHASKDPFQTRIISNAGEIYIWDSAMEVVIDDDLSSPDKLVEWVVEHGPTEITISYDGVALSLDLGSARVRVQPGSPESLHILTPASEIIVF